MKSQAKKKKKKRKEKKTTTTTTKSGHLHRLVNAFIPCYTESTNFKHFVNEQLSPLFFDMRYVFFWNAQYTNCGKHKGVFQSICDQRRFRSAGASRQFTKWICKRVKDPDYHIYGQTKLIKQCSPRSDAAFCGVWLESTLLIAHQGVFTNQRYSQKGLLNSRWRMVRSYGVPKY